MFIIWAALNGSHPGTYLCARMSDGKKLRLAMEMARYGADIAFWAYVQPLDNFSLFKYLVCLLAAMDDDWPAVVANPRKAQRKWSRLSWIIGWEGTDAR